MDVDRDAARHNGEALVRIAGEAGHQITTRTLETYRAQGLLPKPAFPKRLKIDTTGWNPRR